MAGTWILQSNPKLYDIDTALRGASHLLARAAVLRATRGRRPRLDLALRQAGRNRRSGDFAQRPPALRPFRRRRPLRQEWLSAQGERLVCPCAGLVGSARCRSRKLERRFQSNRIVTAPMGTVFRLDADEVSALHPLLDARGYDLERPGGNGCSSASGSPRASRVTRRRRLREAPCPGRATITPAMFLLSSTPDRPVDITIEGDSLRLSLARARRAEGTRVRLGCRRRLLAPRQAPH